jgi:hypothetical membrane protein
MKNEYKRNAGLLGFVATAQFVLAVIICQALYSGYSVGQQYVSDLGNWTLAGNNAAIFNASLILAGILGIASAYFIHRAFRNKLFTILLIVNTFCNIPMGVFSEDISLPIHGISAIIGLIFGLGATFMSSKFVKPPLSYAPFILGGVILLAIILQASGFYPGLGIGGIERLEIYPSLLWGLAFDGYLIGEPGGALSTSAVLDAEC